MNKCNSEKIHFSNSRDNLRKIGATIMKNALATAKNGTGDPTMVDLFRKLENSVLSGLSSRAFNQVFTKVSLANRIEESTSAFFNANDLELNTDEIANELEGVIELELEDGGTHTEVVPDPNPKWKISETLKQVDCITETAGAGDDEMFLTGISTYAGINVANKDWEKDDMDTGESDSPDITWGPAAIIVGKSTYESTYLLFEDDLMGKDDAIEISELLGELAKKALEKGREKAKEEIEKLKPANIDDDLWNQIVAAVLKFIVEGIGGLIPRLVEMIGEWLGPDSFSGVFFEVTINYDGTNDPTWQTVGRAIGKQATGPQNTGRATDKFLMPHKEEGDDTVGLYKTLTHFDVFKE